MDDIQIEAMKLFIDHTSKDELAEFIVNLDNAVKGLNKNNSGLAEAYRKSEIGARDARATIASLRQQLDAALGQVAAARVLGSYDMECAQQRAITQSDTPITASDGGAG